MRWSVGAIEGKPKKSSDRAEVDNAGYLLGKMLVKRGNIREDQAQTVVDHARKRGLRFGDAAIDLGLITQIELEHALAAQFDYPYLAPGEGGYSEELVAAFRPFSMKGQAVRNLRTRLTQYWDAHARHALAVLGSQDSEGRSYIAANLAVVFSQMGERTLLVDADLRKSRQHRIFNAANDTGLSAVLVGRATASQVITKLPIFRDLSLMPAGAPPPNTVELLGRKELRNMIADLNSLFDVMIFDTSAAKADAGAELVAAACGSAIMVVRQDKSRLDDTELLTSSLRSAGVDLVGSVITNC